MAKRGGSLPAYSDLEVIRAEAAIPVRRLCARLGIPVSTWYYWRDAHRAGRAVRRWPAPVVDTLELPAEATAHRYSAWGHRKIWAMLRADGYRVSQSSVKRAMARRDLLQPRRYQAEVRALARAEFAAFVAARPWLYHVRTRFRSPWTNGVVERFFGSLKYEHLFREEITNGHQLGVEIAAFRSLYNDVRPHEHLDFDTPLRHYVMRPDPALDLPIQLPGTGPPISYNPDPPRPRTRRPPGPPRRGAASSAG